MSDGAFAGREQCRDCGTSDPALAYRSGRMQRCIDCQHYWNLTHRGHGQRVEMAYTREQFVALKRATPRRCHYCGIDGEGLWEWNVTGVHRKRHETIGWDRIDSTFGYQDGNWVPCCPVCNSVKSNTFSVDEMTALAPTIRAVLDSHRNQPPARTTADTPGATRTTTPASEGSA